MLSIFSTSIFKLPEVLICKSVIVVRNPGCVFNFIRILLFKSESCILSNKLVTSLSAWSYDILKFSIRPRITSSW